MGRRRDQCCDRWKEGSTSITEQVRANVLARKCRRLSMRYQGYTTMQNSHHTFLLLSYPSSNDRKILVQLIVLFAYPAHHLAVSSNDTQTTRKPKRCQSRADTVDSVPPPLPDQSSVLFRVFDLTWRKTQPFCCAPDEMPHPNSYQCCKPGEGNSRV